MENFTGTLPLEITPVEVAARMAAGKSVRLIDVRETDEHSICNIEGATLIPIRTVPQHRELLEDDGSLLVVFCHHGLKSLNVVNSLRRRGVEHCQSMAGGIDLWSLEVDPKVARY